MRVLIACEYSGNTREAFKTEGHYAMSCDLLPTEQQGLHYQGDVFDITKDNWDLMIAHPPCTYLANSGARWLYDKAGNRVSDRWDKMREAAEFFKKLLNCVDIPRVVVENPIIHKHAKAIIGVPQTQVIHPWQHGHGETKATCLWLRGDIQPLKPSNIVSGREARIHKLPPSKDRWKLRSTTYPGISKAMAQQWGSDE